MDSRVLDLENNSDLNHMFCFIQIPLILVLCFRGEQVVAITVFFLLVIAFYSFFAPFLGKELYEYVAIAIYSTLVSTSSCQAVTFFKFSSPQYLLFIFQTISLFFMDFQALAVFILYVRCTAIDPADPGILMSFDQTLVYRSHNKADLPGKQLVIIFW